MTESMNLKLVVDDEEIICSRDALQKSSEYFRAMFSSNMKETNSSCIVINDMSVECMKWLVKFSVDSTICKFEDVGQACQILNTACILQFSEVITKAAKYLIMRLSVNNCLGIMGLADMHALNNLYNISRRKVLWEFHSVKQCNEFLQLSYDFIKDLLACTMLNVQKEIDVLTAVIDWVSYDEEKRVGYLADLLQCVRFDCITQDEVQTVLLEVVNEEICQGVKLIAFSSKQDLVPRSVPQRLWIIGENANSSKIVCVHGTLNGDFKLLDDLPVNNSVHHPNGPTIQRIGFTVTVVGKDLYVMGGGLLNCRLCHDCWKYDTFQGSWTEIGDIPTPRRHHSAVAANDRYIILIGGFGKYRVMLDVVEMYDTWTGKIVRRFSLSQDIRLLPLSSKKSSLNEYYSFISCFIKY